MSAKGRVRVGFSLPWVALYNNNDGVISYSNAMRLARGVSVSLSPEMSETTKFYADNGEQESDGGRFTGGTASITADEPLKAAKALFEGSPSADANGWVKHGDSASRPFVGIGYVVEYVSDNVHFWVPTVIRKAKLTSLSDEANTRADGIEYQTSTIEFDIFRGDDANHDWKWVNEEGFSTEAAAETALKAVLGTGSALDGLTVSSAAGTTTGYTALSVSGHAPTGSESYVYTISTGAVSVNYNDDLSSWTDWDGDDEISATTGRVITVAVVNGSDKAVAVGHATVQAAT